MPGPTRRAALEQARAPRARGRKWARLYATARIGARENANYICEITLKNVGTSIAQ
jgi:hypothetical protein